MPDTTQCCGLHDVARGYSCLMCPDRPRPEPFAGRGKPTVAELLPWLIVGFVAFGVFLWSL
jgi:hypothetical protein